MLYTTYLSLPFLSAMHLFHYNSTINGSLKLHKKLVKVTISGMAPWGIRPGMALWCGMAPGVCKQFPIIRPCSAEVPGVMALIFHVPAEKSPLSR